MQIKYLLNCAIIASSLILIPAYAQNTKQLQISPDSGKQLRRATNLGSNTVSLQNYTSVMTDRSPNHINHVLISRNELRMRPMKKSFTSRKYRQYNCGKGAKKQLIVAGTEDNFAAMGNEALQKSPRVLANRQLGWDTALADTFDNAHVNKQVFTHLKLPPDVTKGVFMIGMKPIGGLVNTDSMIIGNLSGDTSPAPSATYRYSVGSWAGVDTADLKRRGNNYYADFSQIKLGNAQNLQDYITSSHDNTLDVYVQDDHSVDYVAAVICTPANNKGMTWGIREPQPEPVDGVVHVGCQDKYGISCDPFKGDTPCKTARPILCINPLQLEKPLHLSESKWDKWSGGIIASTKPMPAPSKLSVANQACAEEFGKGWRVAEHHDAKEGRSGWMFSAYGNLDTNNKRFWADVADQPNAVCWNRAR